MYTSNFFKKVLSLLVCATLVLSYLPVFTMNVAAAETPLNIISGSKKADPGTINWEAYFGPDKMDTEFAGGVWTDKSVFTNTTNQLPGVTLDDENNFLVALSSIASNLSITGHTSAPTDTMLVLDMSGSMVDDTYPVGIIRQSYNNYVTANGIDMSLINAMIDATNDTIDKLMKQNTNNRVGVVLYSGNITNDVAATANTATVILPLGRYNGIDGEYLSVDTNYTTSTLYRYQQSWFGGSYVEDGQATYVAEGTAVNVSVKNGLKTEAGGNVTDSSKQAIGGTYLQNGLYKAMNQFLNVTDTIVPQGKPQAGAERMPVLVLMTDGAPTIATTSYTNINDSNTGDGTETTNRITFLTQLTAAYTRGRIASHYQENNNDEKDILFLTLGLGTENSSAATNTLYPAGSNSDLVTYWTRYLNANAGQNVTAITGENSLTVRREADVEAMNYVDTYYYADNAQGLVDSFQQIVSEIQLKSESYATLVEGGNADLSGYVTFEDELGEMMQVADMKGVLMSDGNGGTVLYTGKGIAESMTNGILGTVDNPTDRGDELVRTVRERIPGTTTTMAQQLIGNAYADQQLYFADDNNWSNYIGWYADADGNYVGFWDKDSGYENAPQDAVYANQSYGYLGVNGDSDMMHVVVMVRTELATLHQTVNFKIPASLLPTVQYKVTLNEDDPTKVEAFEREDAIPMQLVFEVGLRPDINSVNMEQKIAEHIAKGGHVHRNDDGTVTFYTNEWAIGNDTNQNGIPDPEEVETAMVAESHFHPAMDNSRYYYTEDTLVLNANGNPITGATRPTGQTFHHRYIYDEDERITMTLPIAAETLANKAQYNRDTNQWFIPAGTIFQEVARFKTEKTENITNTLDYSDFPAVFENGQKQDVYAFLGNNGSITVAPAQGIALTKTIDQVSEDPNAPTAFTFTVTLSESVANPIISNTEGNLLTGIANVSGNKISVTLQAGQTVVISGIPTGVTYTVTEETTRYYSASSTNASGTVAANTIHAVDFVNTAKYYGSLIVSKDVNYPQGFVPSAAHNNKEFTIHVEFTGDITGIAAPQGAIQNGNLFTLVLKDGGSATFANIPIGVTYQVREDTPPGGYAFQDLRYSDANQMINGNDTDQAHVVNQYTLEPVSPKVKIQGDKTLVTNGADWGGQTFTVELLRIDNFADQEPESIGLTATMTQTNPHYEMDLSSIKFTAAGTYYFRAVEVIPTNANQNIAYDRTFGLFSITVGDADADGKLEIQAVNAYQTTTVSGNATDGWVVEKDFTNVVTTDQINLNIQKHIVDANTMQPVNAHLGDITFGLFNAMRYENSPAPSYYALTNTQGKASIMIPVTKEMIADNGGRVVYFMREIAPAGENRVVGMNYDESWLYAISIMWDEENNQAMVSYAPIENEQVGGYSVYTEGSFTFEHTNTYENNVSVDINLTGTKTLNGGNELGGREFSFTLYESTAAFVAGDVIQTVSNNGNAIAFNNISFTAPGVYYMVAKENASTLGGITVDATEYHITVEVEKFVDTDGTTRLRVAQEYPTVVVYGTANNVGVNGLHFNNTYTVIGSDDVTIGGKKILDGRAMVAGEFIIGLYSDSACQNQLETTANRADGTFAFSKRTYTAEDLGENLASKTYTYYVKEINNGKGGVTYDTNVYTVTVTVSHENGLLKVTPSNNAITLEIQNTYEAKPVDVVLNGSKVLSGDWSNVTNKNFTFQLLEANSDFTITNQTPMKTATVNGGENFQMTLSYQDGEEGFYYYVLKEQIPQNRIGGVGYDAGEYHVTVNVSDPGDGQLVALTTIYRPGTGNTATAVFTNTYTVEPTSITLEGTKAYVNGVTGASITMEEGMFSFVVLEGENENAALVATGYNLADGSIRFTPIRYTAAGTHAYNVVEVSGQAGGVDYDNTVFTVTVTVKDNGNGTLTAEADYDNTPVAFKNTYTHQSVQYTPEAQKVYEGDEMKAFDFVLSLNGEEIQTKQNDPQGKVLFDTLTFNTVGMYQLEIKEQANILWGLIRWDRNVYTITLYVEDDGAGNLFINEEKSVITSIKGNDTITFRNAHHDVITHKDVFYPTEPTVSIDGKAVEKNDILLYKVSYTNFDTVPVDVTFTDVIPEHTTYVDGSADNGGTLTNNTLSWSINDVAPGATVTVSFQVKVVDTNITVINNATVLEGENEYHTNQVSNPVKEDIVVKDVFYPAQPTISIDGDEVQKNHILLYKVTYTNSDDFDADVVITDAIPQHTTYVDGSADNGGTFQDGVLTWNLKLAAGESKTVSFQVKVVDTNITVINQASAEEGNNQLDTNQVTNPVKEELVVVKEDTIVKDVFQADAPTVSIDGQQVNVGDTLLYTITYHNADDAAADVVITDTIPQHTTYVDGSAVGGTFQDGVLTWNVKLDGGQSKTVSFQVTVNDPDVTVINQAHAFDGVTHLDSNVVTNRTPAPIPVDPPSDDVPKTGDNTTLNLWIALLFVSGGIGFGMLIPWRKRKKEQE